MLSIIVWWLFVDVNDKWSRWTLIYTSKVVEETENNFGGLLFCRTMYTVSQKKLGHFFTAYNFRNIEQIFTKFGTNQSLFILNIMSKFILINFGK